MRLWRKTIISLNWRSILLSGAGVLGLSACATTSPVKPMPDEDISTPSAQIGEVIIAAPDPAPAPAPDVKSPPPNPPAPPVSNPPPKIEIPVYQSPLTELTYWSTSDHRPALSAFRRSCKRWETADPEVELNIHLPEYGQYKDWQEACALALIMPVTRDTARQFFENQFIPVTPTGFAQNQGLITGYYQPEINVRTIPDDEFFEPILAKPKTLELQNQVRALIGPQTSRVIAYGRPLDVFFMQIQGSGHIRFKNGRKIRAAYNGNNGQDYRSIGRVLIQRGELTKDKSSKADIENWMMAAGPEKSRALMNENPRYIYFVEQAIKENEGPLGAMRVPLTARGSLAVDPRYHPYGVPYYLTVNIPQKPRDYKGKTSGQIVIAQDTGKAIRGAFRGDFYFGSGAQAGSLAGVMKHPADWTILLPRGLVARKAPSS